jgi:hypothetical protein
MSAAIWTALLLLSAFVQYGAASEVVRGVNLGGWLLTEPWYALLRYLVSVVADL